jgi:type I restriction enzyme S subunit
MVNLNQRVLLGLTVPVAPLAEQKLIADKLNALLTRVDACRERLERVPLILKSFRQAVLTAAMSGELTEDRHINEQPAATENGLLGDYCDVLGGKRLPKGFELTDEPTEYPYVRVTDFDNFSIKEGRIKFVPAGAYPKISRYIITENDIYISIAGTIGLVGQVPPSLSGANLTENAARIIVRRGFVPRYLMYQLASPVLQEQMRRKKIATTQEKFGLFRIKSLEVTRPSLEEQLEIVRLIETLFAYADRLEERYKAVQACIEQLKPALLAKAFRGELVPQDPKDEPASVLLERIRASRVTAEGAEEITRAKRRTNLVKKPKARIIMLKRKDVEPSHLSAILKADGPLSAEALWSASQLDIDDFYDQLKDEEAGGLLKENVGEQRLLEAA